ncbi:hypothetical protein JOC77_003403 [Peribacillus deserti]|uniref:DUF3899 domain-containing protein n=1 Tax=Peribacillus deserti TaxID=673318 RepID=A0ABS2QMI0_9BACI|nr:DUF3899 domain-containing protein [Peribacillus deserti]MBM7693959.1 hypothetical protein [Peribacillus deserti]
MNYIVQRLSIITGINIFVSLLLAFFGENTYYISFMNCLFFIGLFYIVIGAFLFVVEGGFFNGIIFSMKNFLKLDKLGAYVAQFDDADLEATGYPSQKKYNITLPFLISGLLCCLASLIGVI